MFKRLAATFLLGISSGLPLLLTGSTLQAWMTDMKLDLGTIGLFSLATLPYTLKFLWSPFLDRYLPPALDRRRGWILVTQLALAALFVALGALPEPPSLYAIAVLSFLISFASASQDIVIDAYRREILEDSELGLGSSLGINGYRIGMLLAGAFALYLADNMPWSSVYYVMAGLMVMFVGFTIVAPPTNKTVAPPRSLKEAVVEPFRDFFKRSGAFEILLFILLYKVGDQMASSMTTPFILGVGFSKTTLAGIAKTFGLAATLGGGLLGGAILLRLGIDRSLWIFGILQALSTVSFAFLAMEGMNTTAVLTLVIAIENGTGGMGTAAYSAFMARLCNRRFTATQFALLTSLMGVPRVFLASPTGFIAERLGWQGFFVFCTLVAVPGLLLLMRQKHWNGEASGPIPSASPA